MEKKVNRRREERRRLTRESISHWLFLMPAIAIASFAATKAHGEMVSKEWSNKEKSDCLDIEPSSSSSSGSTLHIYIYIIF